MGSSRSSVLCVVHSRVPSDVNRPNVQLGGWGEGCSSLVSNWGLQAPTGRGPPPDRPLPRISVASEVLPGGGSSSGWFSAGAVILPWEPGGSSLVCARLDVCEQGKDSPGLAQAKERFTDYASKVLAPACFLCPLPQDSLLRLLCCLPDPRLPLGAGAYLPLGSPDQHPAPQTRAPPLPDPAQNSSVSRTRETRGTSPGALSEMSEMSPPQETAQRPWLVCRFLAKQSRPLGPGGRKVRTPAFQP